MIFEWLWPVYVLTTVGHNGKSNVGVRTENKWKISVTFDFTENPKTKGSFKKKKSCSTQGHSFCFLYLKDRNLGPGNSFRK